MFCNSKNHEYDRDMNGLSVSIVSCSSKQTEYRYIYCNITRETRPAPQGTDSTADNFANQVVQHPLHIYKKMNNLS